MKCLLLGAGKTSIECLKTLVKLKKNVSICLNKDELVKIKEYYGVIDEVYTFDEFYNIDFNKFDYIVRSPGLSILNHYIKHLKDNPIVVTKTEIKYEIKEVAIKNDSVKVDSTNNVIKNYYNYKDNYLKANISHFLDINSNKGELLLSDISSTTNLYLDIIEKNKKPAIIARLDNPYLDISNIDGGFVNLENSKVLNKYYKQQNRWNFSVNLGVFTIYNINTKKFEAGPGFGASIGYSFAQW